MRSAALALGFGLALGLACGSSSGPVAVGTLERDRLELVAESSEPIAEHAVREGDVVAAGQILVRLDDSRFRALLEQGESTRQRAAARLAELERGPRPERIAEARARVEGAEGTLETARRELVRSQELVRQGVAAEARLDQQRAAFDQALAERDAAAAGLAERVEGTTEEELAQARAGLAEAEAALSELRVRAARLEVRAPKAGRVDALPFELGERPPAGAVVAVLLAEGAPYARVYVPEAIRARVTPGTPARIAIDGIEREFAGRVRSVASEASFTPYFALTERDRGRLVYLAKVDLVEPEAHALPTGVPVEAAFDGDAR